MTPAAPGRSSVLASLEVIVDAELGVDAVRAGDLLVLRDGQTHENAVEQLIKLFPNEHVDDIARLVRDHMPNAPSLDNLTLQLAAASPDWVKANVEPMHMPMSRRKVKVITGAVAAAVALLSVGTYALLSHLTAGPFEDPEFQQLAAAAHFQCVQQSDTTAECRNTAEGTLWQVTAFEGVNDDPTSYRFSRGNQLAVVWVFPTVEARESFPRLAAYERLYPYLTSRDRVMVGSTDAPVMANLARVLDRSILDGTGRSQVPGGPSLGSVPADAVPSVSPTSLDPWPTDGNRRATTAPSAPSQRPSRASSPDTASEGGTRADTGSGAASEPSSTSGSEPSTGTPVPESTPTSSPTDPGSQGADPNPTHPTPSPSSPPDKEGVLTIRLPGIRITL